MQTTIRFGYLVSIVLIEAGMHTRNAGDFAQILWRNSPRKYGVGGLCGRDWCHEWESGEG
jgi:hypothetical protein